MQINKMRSYAPKARRDFIAAVTRRAAKFSLTAEGISPNREEGHLVFIEGQPYPKSIGIQRQKLASRIEQQGFDQVMEAAAYTWLNRFAASASWSCMAMWSTAFRCRAIPPATPRPRS